MDRLFSFVLESFLAASQSLNGADRPNPDQSKLAEANRRSATGIAMTLQQTHVSQSQT